MFPPPLPQPERALRRSGRHAWSLGCVLALVASLSWLWRAEDLAPGPAPWPDPWASGSGWIGNR